MSAGTLIEEPFKGMLSGNCRLTLFAGLYGSNHRVDECTGDIASTEEHHSHPIIGLASQWFIVDPTPMR
jgi:hypothetical protein